MPSSKFKPAQEKFPKGAKACLMTVKPILKG